MPSQTRRKTPRPQRGTRKARSMQEGKGWLVGTSGLMVSRDRWLSIPTLNCLEVNSTFYSLLGKKTGENLAGMPERVSFVFKVSKYITHLKRLNGVGEAWGKFVESVAPLRSRTAGYLVQLPPSFKRTDENVARLQSFAKMVARGGGRGPQMIVEFRDESWLVPATYALCRKLGWCVSGTLVQRLPDSKSRKAKSWMGTMPTGVYLPPRTSGMMYFRVHGKPGYRGYVLEEQLRKIAKQMAATGAPVKAMMFNNVFFDDRGRTCKATPAAGRYAAVCDAGLFGKLVGVTM